VSSASRRRRSPAIQATPWKGSGSGWVWQSWVQGWPAGASRLMTWPRRRRHWPSSHWTVTGGAVGSVLAKGILLGPGPGCSSTAGPLSSVDW
jgi:hypothetical protein